MKLPFIPVIIGPTASGKTNAVYYLAEIFRKEKNICIEIISADSRQVYKHISIATSHPPIEYLKKFKHHFVDELQLNDEFNAGQFGKLARERIKEIYSRGNSVIVAGGSGLYINSLVYGFFDFEEDESFGDRRKEIRSKLRDRIYHEGIELLHTELMRIDRDSASKMLPQNERRIIRALEIFYLTGIPISKWQVKKIDVEFNPVMFGLKLQRERLYESINLRTEEMLRNGLVEEIESLKEKGFDYRSCNSLNSVGVKEVFDYLDSKISYQGMVELIKQNTRRFAKRQMTWFRKDKNINWIDVNDTISSYEIANNIFEKFIRKTSV